ncbi:MAG: class I SAM-dependent methyltransferase [Rhodospirillaceae bacterium]|nr:class I SAM-dependent methyltransferase [Rhodospirillaceae bacterium]
MTENLTSTLRQRIASDGPLSVADYMQAALLDPDHGYYSTQEPFGVDGDFITAPEISQMFGELIGLWAAVVWQGLGSPETIALVELGPGRGSLMSDVLRASRAVPDFSSAIEVHVIEASPRLRQIQRETLVGHDITWHDDIEGIPGVPSITIANEFLDALPIRQIIRAEDGWHERLVDWSGEHERFEWSQGDALTDLARHLPLPLAEKAKVGDIWEISTTARHAVTALSKRISLAGGAALIIDYGYAVSSLGDTLQAVRNHSSVSVFDAPGSADLTAHVDFAACAEIAAAAGALTHGPTTQRAFLRGLGIELRAARLAAAMKEKQRLEIESALARLIDPSEMGTLFKVMAITAPNSGAPPGL